MQTGPLELTMQIETLDLRKLTDADAAEIARILVLVWPKVEKPVEVRTQQMLDMGKGYTGIEAQAPRSFVIRDGTISTTAGEMTIAGLARVCSDPEYRGRGLGELITKAALHLVDSGAFACSLFQTSPEVQPFYEKMGGCVVDNAIVNSLAEDPKASPFSDKVVMRYPSSAAWPEGEIDLLGPGY